MTKHVGPIGYHTGTQWIRQSEGPEMENKVKKRDFYDNFLQSDRSRSSRGVRRCPLDMIQLIIDTFDILSKKHVF